MENKENTKRGWLAAFSVGDVPDLVYGLGIGAVIAAIMLLVLANIQTSPTVCTGSCTGANVLQPATYNALGNGTAGIGNVLAQYPLIGTVAGLVILLGFVVFAFYRKRAGEGL